MSIPLGSIELSDHVVLDGIEVAPERADSFSRSLFGVATRIRGPQFDGGRTLYLVSNNHITYAQMLDIKELQKSGDAVALIHPRGTFTVVVTAVDLTPDTELVDPFNDPDLWYTGTVTIVEV